VTVSEVRCGEMISIKPDSIRAHEARAHEALFRSGSAHDVQSGYKVRDKTRQSESRLCQIIECDEGQIRIRQRLNFERFNVFEIRRML